MQVSEQQANFVDQVIDRVPGAKKVGNDGRNAVVALTSVAGVDYYVDAKVRGLIMDKFNIDINDQLLGGNTPGLALLKKKDIGYGAVAGLAAMKNKKAGVFLAGAVLLKRWLESRGAVTAGNPSRGGGGGSIRVVRP